jgi:glutathione S-transferase
MASTATKNKLASAKPHLFYMSAWFCPFAHRATLALEHHSRGPVTCPQRTLPI